MNARAAALAALVCAACAGPTESSRSATPPPPALLNATTMADAGSMGPLDTVHLTVTEANGLSPALVTQVYQAARDPLHRCMQSGGGKVEVRITRQGGFLHLSVEPGASLDPSARHCVLEALSTVDLEETGGNVGGPTVPPSGFTSLVTVSW